MSAARPDQKSMERFFSDPNYSRLLEFDREQRLLFITDLSETRVSSFLAWLFKPYEGHGLSDLAVKQLLANAWRVHFDGKVVPAPTKVRSMAFYDLLVRTEFQVEIRSGGPGRGKSIDILMVSRSQKLLIAIENKFGSGLRPNQLKSYREGLEKIFPDYRRVLVYLDPNEESESNDTSDWIRLDYSWLVDLLNDQIQSGLLSERATSAMQQFLDYLRGWLGNSSVDSELKESLIEKVSDEHPHVLAYMRDEASKKDWSTYVAQQSGQDCDELVIEYFQRKRLWNEVLGSYVHLKLIREVRRLMAANQALSALKYRVRPTRVVFDLSGWRLFMEDESKEFGFRVSALSVSGDEELVARDPKYFVRSAVLFDHLRSDLHPSLRDAAKSIPKKQRSDADTQRWMQLAKTDVLPVTEAAKAVARMILEIDGAIQSNV